MQKDKAWYLASFLLVLLGVVLLFVFSDKAWGFYPVLIGLGILVRNIF